MEATYSAAAMVLGFIASFTYLTVAVDSRYGIALVCFCVAVFLLTTYLVYQATKEEKE